FDALEKYKAENNDKIYQLPAIREPYINIISPMMEKMYEKLRDDIIAKNSESIIYKHYLYDNYVFFNYFPTNAREGYQMATEPDDLVTDFIACMTDDYFIDAFKHLFPNDELNEKVNFTGYFDKKQ
ncbi:MAG: phosphohydrolase, partial [Clostridiales bacterium]|nr:phosphohydrolase [Clostridiales bacterium]